MIRTQKQIQAAEKALSALQTEILLAMRKGAFIKRNENYSAFSLMEKQNKRICTVPRPALNKLYTLGFLLRKYEWPYADEEYYLRDLTWIKE